MDVNELLARISGMLTDVPHNSGLVYVVSEVMREPVYLKIDTVRFDENGNICIVID